MKQRVKWIDVAKFLGIFAIYLGHLGDKAGLSFQFVFTFHVPLFFFISGCMSSYDHEQNILRFIWKRFKGIMVPFYCFAILSIIINVLQNNSGLGDIKDSLILVGKGCIRNSYFAYSLWFLSCLFVMEVVFKTLKLIKHKIAIIICALVFFVISELLINPRPFKSPHWVYNIDSMMYYFIFYVLGYFLYPPVFKLFDLDSTMKRVIFAALLVFSTVYMAFLFEGAIPNCTNLTAVNMLYETLQPLIGIIFILTLSKLLEDIEILSMIGMDTLYLCGNEYIIKTLFPMFCSMVGLTVTIDNPLKAYSYTIIVIVLNYKIVNPAEKRIASAVKNKLYRSIIVSEQ